MKRSPNDIPVYLDTPRGIVTPAGTTFQTTERLLDDFAGGVFQYEPLASFVLQAETWLRSPATLLLVLLPLLSFGVPIWLAVVLSVSVCVGWAVLSPSFPSKPLASIFSVLEKPLLLALYYIVSMTLFGWAGETATVIVGLTVFVSVRLGAVQALLKGIAAPMQSKMYAAPIADQILRALIVRSALRHNVPLPDIKQLESSAKDAWTRTKRK